MLRKIMTLERVVYKIESKDIRLVVKEVDCLDIAAAKGQTGYVVDGYIKDWAVENRGGSATRADAMADAYHLIEAVNNGEDMSSFGLKLRKK